MSFWPIRNVTHNRNAKIEFTQVFHDIVRRRYTTERSRIIYLQSAFEKFCLSSINFELARVLCTDVVSPFKIALEQTIKRFLTIIIIVVVFSQAQRATKILIFSLLYSAEFNYAWNSRKIPKSRLILSNHFSSKLISRKRITRKEKNILNFWNNNSHLL